MLYIKKKGSVDYTIVGTPTIVDGVASGFSDSDYIYVNSPISSDTNSIEVSCKFTTGTISEQGVIGSQSNFSKYGFNINSNGTLRTGVRVSAGGTEANKVLSSTLVLSANVTYYAFMSCVKSTHIFTLKISTDNKNWTSYTSDIGAFDNFVSSGRIILGYTQNGVFAGSIDINETYIKIDGQPWFGVCPVEVKKHQIMGPVGYELSGNATVTNGILTGVDSSSSCGTSISLPSDFNELEFMFKARRYSWTVGSNSQIIPLCGWGAGSGSTRRITTNAASGEGQGTRVFNGSSQIVNIDNSRFDVTAYTNSGYYTRLRVIKNENDYTYELWLSGDKQVWVTASANYSTNICTQKLWLLRNSSGSTSSIGEMDLNETYVKVDGKIWFWQPRETERIVVNGVEVWNKNEV